MHEVVPATVGFVARTEAAVSRICPPNRRRAAILRWEPESAETTNPTWGWAIRKTIPQPPELPP